MKLETAGDRYKVIERLLNKSFKNDSLWVRGDDTFDEWAANMDIMVNLFYIEDMINTEAIFLDALYEMYMTNSRYPEDKEIFLDIVKESITHFIDTLLLTTLETSFDDLERLKFQTPIGQKFHKDVSKKLDALIKEYQDIYYL